MPGTESHSDPLDGPALPTWLDRYTNAALVGLVAGTVLSLFAFLTNPVPDPSFPWATLPASLRLPVTQPRIEHWPVTYSVGIWLWIAGFPGLFFAAYRRYGDRFDRRPAFWLAALPTAAMYAWTTYCRVFWPKPDPATWNAPSYTLVCWLYCSTYDPLWSNAAYLVATVGVLATALAYRDSSWSTYALGAFGVLAFPLGIPALFEAYRRSRADRTGAMAEPAPA